MILGQSIIRAYIPISYTVRNRATNIDVRIEEISEMTLEDIKYTLPDNGLDTSSANPNYIRLLNPVLAVSISSPHLSMT
jgi:hypothetical protein